MLEPHVLQRGLKMLLASCGELLPGCLHAHATPTAAGCVLGAVQALYAKAGYAEVGREKPGLLGGLMGSARPRVLMRKQLRSV